MDKEETSREEEANEVVCLVNMSGGLNFCTASDLKRIVPNFQTKLLGSYIELIKNSEDYLNSQSFTYANKDKITSFIMAQNLVNSVTKIEKNINSLSQGDVVKILITDSCIVLKIISEEEIQSGGSSLNNEDIYYYLKNTGYKKLTIKEDIQIIQNQVSSQYNQVIPNYNNRSYYRARSNYYYPFQRNYSAYRGNYRTSYRGRGTGIGRGVRRQQFGYRKCF